MDEKIDQTRQEISLKPNLESPPANLLSRKMLFFGIIVGFLFCFVLSVGAYYYLNSKKQRVEIPIGVKPIPTVVVQVTMVPTVSVQTTVAPTFVWLSKPREISSIQVFKKKKDLPDTLSYYLTDEAKFAVVAEFSDGSTLINCTLPMDGPSEPPVIRFIETKDKKYSCLTNYLDEWLKKDIKGLLSSGIVLEEKEIEGLTSPETIESSNKKFLKVRVLNQTFDILKNPKLILDAPFGPIYEDTSKILDSEEIFARGLYLRLKDNTLVSYKLKLNFYSDNGIPEIYFNTNPGVKNQNVFTQKLASSCSLTMMDSVPVIKDGSSLIASKKEIGKTANGELIYQVIEPTNELVKILYKFYSEGRSYSGGPKIESIEQMAAAVNHFLWKDPLGDWQIFQNSEYGSLAECGKPVIYLYPTEKTEVAVKVGALIRKSEPEYKKEGWKVMAYPDGRLIYEDRQYGSLFWEGLGKGLYPNLKNYGFAVAQEDLLLTIKRHLNLLGLNQKESTDFLQFWAGKLPKTPYVRLTWFGTREMDTLASLEVVPNPDTKIRIFLEFEGLNKPKDLIPQKLSSAKRVGFTLVEWGGLLIGGQE